MKKDTERFRFNCSGISSSPRCPAGIRIIVRFITLQPNKHCCMNLNHIQIEQLRFFPFVKFFVDLLLTFASFSLLPRNGICGKSLSDQFVHVREISG
jgi:hypothetical protein